MTTPEGQGTGEVRTAIDPFSGKQVEIRDDLIKKLRGQYACGPTLPNGEPEFGWRTFDAPPIQVKAADKIERLTHRVKVLEAALGNLVNAKALKGVREVVAGWNGEGKPDGPYERHHSKLGATLPKTNCGAVYELDEALQAARTTLTHGGGK